ncbi:hypothetical protein [Kordiimonas marina]|uniref:hypothetical protein n=1 Tax=Kordiimonas marina TaxID=2872312 RepID=UPI001FF31E58|nr:hypothetical protein [Kordiimonas marina]MCJ9429233.1 hypothetical protein [Kordiimonas marina]
MTTMEDIIANLTPERPLLMVDADEVLLQFVARLERFLLDVGYELRLESFRLSGNIFDQASGDRADAATCKGLIARFFDDCVDDIGAVEGAAEALAALSEHYQPVILTNVPKRCRARRQASLATLGLDYPVLANAGEKGPAAKRLASAAAHPAVFIDDLPPQHASVAAHAPHVHRVHFVADPRLGPLLPKAEHAHIRLDDWPALQLHLTDLLSS